MTTSMQIRAGAPAQDRTARTPCSLALVSAPNESQVRAALQHVRPPGGGIVELHAAGQGGHRAALLFGEGAEPVVAIGPATATARPIAFMLPGLGDHYLDMGAELYRTQPTFRAEIDRCAELLKPELGLDLRDLIYPTKAQHESTPNVSSKGAVDLRRMLGRDDRAPSAHETRLNRTSIAQPALFVVEYAVAKLLEAWGLRPNAMIGYSLGEYVAACLGGVLSLEASLTLVARRAQLIETLPPGAMLAVNLPEEQVLPLLGRHLSLSAVTGPELTVVAGAPEEIGELERALAGRAVTVRRVQTSHAFHSAMMRPIADRVTALAKTYAPRAPAIPYVSNVTGRFITEAEVLDPAYWAAHLCSPVRFREGLHTLAERPERVFLEVGPGQSLSSIVLLDPGIGARPDRLIVASMRHAYDPQSDTVALFKAVSRLWVENAALDAAALPAQPLADHASDAETHGTTPSTPTAEAELETRTERDLAAIWSQLLPGHKIGPTTSFFELGGNSLTATRLINRIQRSFRVSFPLRRIYEAGTLRAMAAAIEATKSGRSVSAPSGQSGQSGRLATQSTAAPQEAIPTVALANGLVVRHQNLAETQHFYDDIFAHRSYVKHGIRIPDGACVFDVGANIGLFTLFAHREAKDVRVFSFEPAPRMFEILSKNIAEQGIRATALNVGVSNVEGEASFTFYPRSTGMSSFHADEAEEKHNLKTIISNQKKAGVAEVSEVAGFEEELLDVRFQSTVFTAKLRRLSDVIREQRVERIDLIKIDVQKCELEVIEGIDDEHWPMIRQVVLEAHDADGRVEVLRSRLAQHGFKVTVQQDELYAGTNIHNLYAVRDGL
ncbi:FkbM family methyltransferase [Pendulispora rubella]|uniref:FkbM family methyltransferase n=1 Tax=Pendulispora rubella TaxID=2741070 RepID=A0ABZ2LKR9_9BACT